MRSSHQNTLLPGQVGEHLQTLLPGHLAVLHIHVPHIAQEGPHIVLTKTSGAPVVNKEDPTFVVDAYSVKGKEFDITSEPVGTVAKDSTVVTVEDSSDTDSINGKEFDPNIKSVSEILENPTGYSYCHSESSSDDDYDAYL